MILKGSQRGGGKALADHLMNTRDNDHVHIVDIRGVAASDLHGAFLEIEATSLGTKSTQPFFSVSINPPENERLTTEDFLNAAQAIEEKFELSEQSRAIVTHEKNARLHAHVVWSRIDIENMRTIQLSYSRLKLREVSRELYREHGYAMPEGMRDREKKRGDNFTPQIWQQAKRIGEDPRDLKQILANTYQDSDGVRAFQAQLEAQAMQLARGDRRGFVVVHHTGEALPLNRYLGLSQKDIRAKLGKPDVQMTVDQARSLLSARMTAQAEKQLDDLKHKQMQDKTALASQAQKMREEHRNVRETQKTAQDARTARETLERDSRLRKGIRGLWQRLTGEHGRIAAQNKSEAEACHKRDIAEFDALRIKQLDERATLQADIKAMREKQLRETNQQRAILGHWLSMDKDGQREAVKTHVQQIEKEKSDWRKLREERQNKGKDRGRTL